MLADLPLLAAPNAKDQRRKLEERRTALLAEATRQRQVARDEQAVGDGIYWPIFNLDLKNPAAAEALTHAAPEQLVADILAAERRIIALMEEIAAELEGQTSSTHGWPLVPLGDVVIAPTRNSCWIDDTQDVRMRCRVNCTRRALFYASELPGALIKTKEQSVFRRAGDIPGGTRSTQRLGGAMAIVPDDLDGAIAQQSLLLVCH